MTTPIIVMTHGLFGRALVDSATLILGPLESVHVLTLVAGQDPDSLQEELRGLLAAEEPPIILTDLFGGTPSNVATVIAARHGHPVISGVNLPMLIAADAERRSSTPVEAAAAAAEAAVDGVRDITRRLSERSGR